MSTKRYSKQREEIYRAVAATTTHPTAEMVYDWLKPEMPHLSLGTVYRNLRTMAADGRLLELEGTTLRFDANTSPHAHLTCRNCGGVFDVAIPYEQALDRLAESDGSQIKCHHLMFYGICPVCAAKRA